MTNRVKSEFMVCQRKEREKFIEFYGFPHKEIEQENK